MSGKIIWKLVLTALIAIWAASNLIPLKDQDFKTFILDKAEAEKESLEALVQRAEANVGDADNQQPVLYLALRELANKESVDLNTYFPSYNLQTKNIRKRNDIITRALMHQSKGRVKLGLDLQGGAAFTLEIPEHAIAEMSDYQREESLSKVIEIMSERIDTFGVAEPLIRARGDRSVEIQLPNVSIQKNPEVIETLKKPAKLEFRLVHRTAMPGATPTPSGYEILTQEVENSRTGEVSEIPLFIKIIPEATGGIISSAGVILNDYGQPIVTMDFTSEGSDQFAKMTGRIAKENRPPHDIGKMAIVLDGKLYSSPTVQKELRGGAVIEGRFTDREAMELANVLNNPLSIPLELGEMYEVGPSLAEDARDASIQAGLLGAALVVAFMVLYYFSAGIVAVLSVVVNLFIVIGVLAGLGATITLPGVAALVLTIGMAVDANILIFERIREEIRLGKGLSTALQGGFDKAFSTIIDANVTTLITASILVWLGTGPVKGFGVTLAIGIATTVFCALVLSRALMELVVHSGMVRSMFQKSLLKANNFPFQNYRAPAFLVSWVIVLSGMFVLWNKGDDAFGIDFTGGEEMLVSYATSIPTQSIEAIASENDLGEVVSVYQTMVGDENQNLLKIQTENGKGAAVVSALQEKYPQSDLNILGESIIGASVSKVITENAFIAVAVALAGILLYVALRFEFGFGMGAVVATIHDVLMTIGIFVVLGQYAGLGSGQFTAPMVAAILMIVGYSINDTIVVFDRIREELELNPGMKLLNVINLAINKTLSRTLLTSITTLLAALALFIFGAGVINDFALVFIIGIFTGTFSSIFIASPVFFWWHKGDRRHVEEREILPKYDWEISTKASK